MTMQANDYYRKMLPYAMIVQKNTGIPAELEVAFWSWETANGTNNSSVKGNNHAGITSGSKGKDFTVGGYAGYNSVDHFVQDRVRLLNLNQSGYPAILAAARGGKGYEAIIKAHNASAWSEADYNVATIISRAKAAKVILDGGVAAADPKPTPPAVKVCPTCKRAL